MNRLIEQLEKLYALHAEMLELAERKTEVLKKNDLDGLQHILRQEQKCASAMTVAEKEREKAARAFLKAKGDARVAISDCIKAAGSEGAPLKAIQDNMLVVIGKLRQQNELNRQLIQQTLQYVHLTLDLLKPQPEASAYGRPAGGQQPKTGQSFFDSKA
jgi:flagellar biosynthesis/type III secretory pathway chaperone